MKERFVKQKDLKQAFESIQAEGEKKEEIYKKLSQMENAGGQETGTEKGDKRYGRMLRRLAATAAALVALAIPATIYADEIQNFFKGILRHDEQVAEYVQQNVFEDSDGHLKMTVQELLSDQVVVRAVITYEAVDEEGAEWIRQFKEEDYQEGPEGARYGEYMDENNMPHSALSLTPIGYTNMTRGIRELKELRTDTTLAIQLVYEVDDPVELEQAYLYYPMTHEIFRQTTLSIEPNMEIREYQLIGDTNVNEYYDALYIRISDLSYIIYGKQKGLYEHRRYSTGGYAQRMLVSYEEHEKVLPDVTLHFNGKEDYNSNYGYALSPVMDQKGDIATESHHGADTLICGEVFDHGQFLENSEVTLSLESEALKGITINGHYFTLKAYE